MTKLFRPVGLYELALLWDLQFRAFPPRLPHQPIFYPVRNREYAQQIASRWNVSDEASGFSGFVTEFDVLDTYIKQFEPKKVGATEHVEYWIPAEELDVFNQNIDGLIRVTDAYFGESFQGYIPQELSNLRGKSAIDQFVILGRIWDYNRVDFLMETSLNRKAVYINSWFWASHDFGAQGISKGEKRKIIEGLQKAWEVSEIPKRLPVPLTDFK